MSTAFNRIVVLDFEATCRPGVPPKPQEIIEFPSVLLSLPDRKILDTFSSFVRPVHHPKLDPFCTDLTSITQAEVDGAPAFPEVLIAHQAWLRSHDLLFGTGAKENCLFLTCGDWDLITMLPIQCAASSIPVASLPRCYRQWCNIKKVFKRHVPNENGSGMPSMLSALGLPLEGRHHRGIDDCHNIARIAFALADRGAAIEVTSASRDR
jgi:inhibitor of KinA sporulation pathway (predicted exonuclease)